ncbi:MAG: hypothetical protein O9301_15840 [Leptospira sp.]|nr:hypothetical protein [Leptospira sp.]
MKQNKSRIKPDFLRQLLIVLVVLFVSFTGSLFANDTGSLKKGDSLPDIKYTNASEEESPIPKTTSKVLFIADMDASKILHPLLEEHGKGYLEKNNAVLVSDIHRMPFLISKFVALPKMKSYPYTIRLVREEKLADPYPRTKGFVTLIRLGEDGKVQSVSESNSMEVIQKFIEER